MRLALLALALSAPAAAPPVARFDSFDYKGSDPVSATLHLDPSREYRNPILQGFYPDPSITRVGGDFYLVTSTFAYFPGLPVFHSRDLVNWTQIGNAIDRPDQVDFGKLGLSRGLFAPSIQASGALFYILNTCVDCGGNFVMTARNPAGPWSDPVWLPELEGGIDPALFFDDDGTSWIVNNGPPEGKPQYEGHRAIWIQQFDPARLKPFGPRKVLVNGGVDFSKQPIWIEGPHILKLDGFYYLICAEGGTDRGHSQVVLRSRAVTGPYQPFAGNPILTQRDLPRDRPFPITSAGHAQLVDTPDGQWWATFLATRPYQDDLYNTGRETFLLPVEWKDGWPRITSPGQVIPYVHARPKLRKQPVAAPTSGNFSVHVRFTGPKLPPDWMMFRNPHERWYSFAGGSLNVKARPVRLGDQGNPSLLARRQQHIDAEASTAVRFDAQRDGDEAGLAVLQNDDYWYLLSVGRRRIAVERRAGPKEPPAGAVIASAPLESRGRRVWLKIAARGRRYHFFYATRQGAWRPLLTGADGGILSTKVAGGFVGAVFGLYAYSPHQQLGARETGE